MIVQTEKYSINKSYSVHKCIFILRLFIIITTTILLSSAIFRWSVDPIWRPTVIIETLFLISFISFLSIYLCANVQVHGWLAFFKVQIDWVNWHSHRHRQAGLHRISVERAHRPNTNHEPTIIGNWFVFILLAVITVTRWLMSRRWVIVRVNKLIVFTK